MIKIPPYEPSIHEIKLINFFGDQAIRKKPPIWRSEGRSILLVIFINRSGSNLVVDLLEQTGKFFSVGELFDSEFVITAARDNGLDNFYEYIFSEFNKKPKELQKIIVKVSPVQLLFLAKIGLLDNSALTFDFIYINRLDKLRQAISYVIAQRTGAWVRVLPEESEIAVWDSLEINRNLFIEILNILAWIRHEEQLGEAFFLENGICPCRISYEDIQASPTRSLFNKLTDCSILSIGGQQIEFMPRIFKQSNRLNNKIYDEFRTFAMHAEEYKDFIFTFGFDPVLISDQYEK